MTKKKPTENEVNGLDQGRPAQHSEKAGFPFFYLRLRMVCEITGLSKTTVYEYSRNDPDFPKPVKLGATCTACPPRGKGEQFQIQQQEYPP